MKGLIEYLDKKIEHYQQEETTEAFHIYSELMRIRLYLNKFKDAPPELKNDDASIFREKLLKKACIDFKQIKPFISFLKENGIAPKLSTGDMEIIFNYFHEVEYE